MSFFGSPRLPAPYRKKINVARKLFHFSGLLLALSLELNVLSFLGPYLSDPTRTVVVWFLLLLTGILLIIDTLRLRHQKTNAIFWRIFGPLMKKEEMDYYNGTIPYLMGCLFLLLIFPQALIMIGFIFLAVADPCAAYVGSRLGRLRFANGKSLEGLMTFFITSFFLGIFYLGLRSIVYGTAEPFSLWLGQGLNQPALLCVCNGALCAALAELFSPKILRGLVDDNLLTPIAGGIGMLFGGYVLGGYPLQALLEPLGI